MSTDRLVYLCCCDISSASGKRAEQRILAIRVVRISESVYVTDAVGPADRIVTYIQDYGETPHPCLIVVEIDANSKWAAGPLPYEVWDALGVICYQESS